MVVSLFLRLAWRDVWRQRRRTFLIAGAMGMIVSLLVLYDGVIGGFEQGIYGNAIQVMGGNIQIHAPGYNEKIGNKPLFPLADPDGIVSLVEAHPDVTLASKRIVTGGLLTNHEGAFFVSIVGLEPKKEARISIEAQNISQGRYLVSGDGDVIVIGQGLATIMEVEVGDRITLVGNSTHKQTRQRTMTIVGIYDVGIPAIEKNAIFMSLNEAQGLFGLDGEVTEVVINLKQIGQEPEVISLIHASQPGYEIDTWETITPELKRGIDLDKTVLAVFGIVMLGIAAIGIFNLLMMAVFERTREIGVLGALGLKPREIMMLFLMEGILIGVVGAVLGIILGTILNGILYVYGIDFSVYADMADYTALLSSRFYPQFVPLSALRHGLTVLIISALAALSPARAASRREPAEALHYV